MLRRISSRHCRRVWPVCCMQIRIGDSCSVGSGDSVGSAVAGIVGLATVPGVSDQMVVLVPCRVEQ